MGNGAAKDATDNGDEDALDNDEDNSRNLEVNGQKTANKRLGMFEMSIADCTTL